MLRESRPGTKSSRKEGSLRIAELREDNDLILEFSPDLKLRAARLAIWEMVAKAPADDAAQTNKAGV